MITSPKDIPTIIGEAIEISSPAERESYLERVCGGDADLRRRVDQLLDDHARAGDFLEQPATVAAPIVPTISERPGAMIGPYKLLEQIGVGGFGVVFMAEQAQPVRRKVALKVIKPGMDTRQVIARFEAERQALALMEHPHIARVLDAGTTESGRPYFVMELVKGIPITDYCDQSRLPTRERLGLFIDVCHAVQHAHQKGIIHRDIKPSNVLVTQQDGKPLVKVIDFGIAKATGQQLTGMTLFTGFGQLIGTPLYMSPEQAALSAVDVDTRSDVYSLGVLLYELLTSTTPFNKETFSSVSFDEFRRIIREDEPPRPSTQLSTLSANALSTICYRRQVDPRKLNHEVRGELDWIVIKALEKDRQRRYESASAFAADLQRYLDDEPVEACPPSAWYRCTKLARRNRVGMTTIGLVALALIAGTAVSLWQSVRATRAEAQALGEGQKLRTALDETRLQREKARKAVDEMYTRVAEKWLQEQPALTTLQREFLEKAVVYYEEFAKESTTDPQIQFETIRAYQRVGGIRNSLGQKATGSTVWVADKNRNVYVYSNSGALQGSWTASSLSSTAVVEGVATNGTDVWIVDNKTDKVFKHTGAASRIYGSQSAASSFSLNNANTNPKGIVTDGTYIWVLNDSSTDKIFKYTVSGSFQGSWTIDSANASPTGLTIDPTNGSQDIWVVDNGTDKIYQYANSRSRTSSSGQVASSATYALAVGNTNPQGIADPPPPSAASPMGTSPDLKSPGVGPTPMPWLSEAAFTVGAATTQQVQKRARQTDEFMSILGDASEQPKATVSVGRMTTVEPDKSIDRNARVKASIEHDSIDDLIGLVAKDLWR